MLNEFMLHNFKCFEKLSLPLRNINILTGMNGMGKSTIIQGLLLMRQSFQKEKKLEGLYLNGKYVQLGNAQDVLYEKAQNEKIGIGFITEEKKYLFEYGCIPDSDYLPIIQNTSALSEAFLEKDLYTCPLPE